MLTWQGEAGPIFVVCFISLLTGRPVILGRDEDGAINGFGIAVPTTDPGDSR